MEAAQLALQAGLPGEAQQYVTFGYSTKALGTGSEASRQQRLKDLVDKKVAEDKPTLAASDKLAAAQATGEALVTAGLNRVGYGGAAAGVKRSEEHTSELQSLMRSSYAGFCLKKKTRTA